MKIPILTGPTAVGKSDFSIEFAKRTGAEIVSVDSMQLYRRMDIGTSKVDPESRKKVPHHMIDVLDPGEEFDVEKFRRSALGAVENILARGRRPVLTGGSGLYLEALKYGIFEGPSKNGKIREKLLEAEGRHPGVLRFLLGLVDPAAFERTEPKDLKRTVRALEVFILSGEKISSLWQRRRTDERFVIFVLNRDRNELYERINLRVDEMIENGFVEEVRELLESGVSPDLKSMKSIGYKEVVEYIKGETAFEECVDKIKKSTRHYAKRQLTWFRKYEDAVWLDLSKDREGNFTEILKILNWGV